MRESSIGVILLNWNGFDDTAATLVSLQEAISRPACVVVVDNGSEDDSAARLLAWGHANGVSVETRAMPNSHSFAADTWLRIILAEENRGFAGGNNIGLEHLANQTAVTHFLLLNNDALVAPDYFDQMETALRIAPDTGVMGCAIYHFPEKGRIWFAGGYEDRLRGVGLHRYELPASSAPFATGWVTGCAMLISRDLFATIGGLAECYYPIYSEDIDYSLQARAAGKQVMLAPAASVFHKVGGTVGVSNLVPRVAYWQNRHRIFYIRRNYSRTQRAVALTYLVVAKPIRAAIHALSGRTKMASAICQGLVHGLRDDIG